jgi:hypothetical protein
MSLPWFDLAGSTSLQLSSWTFGIRALMSNLAQRGLINTRLAG